MRKIVMRAGVPAFLALAVVASPWIAAAAPAPAPVAPKAFTGCKMCHVTTAGQRSGLGPNLFGLAARAPGTVPGFAYSPAMKAAGGTWSRARLAAFIGDPRKTIPGTKMAFAGLKNPAEAAAVADYLLKLR